MLKLCLLLIAAPSLGLAASSSHLRKALFQNYDKLTRPDHQVELEYGLSVTRLDLCHHKDILTVDAWMKNRWTDERLKWVEGEWSNVSKIHVPWTELWVPDIAFYNSVGESEYVLHENMNRAIVYSSGSILWAPQIHFQTSCSAKEKDQVQSCDIKAGPWTEEKSLLLMKPWPLKAKTQDALVGVDDYLSSRQITITNSSIAAVTDTYDVNSEAEVYNHIKIGIDFKYNSA